MRVSIPAFEDWLAQALDPSAPPADRLVMAEIMAGEGVLAPMAGVAEALLADPAVAPRARRLQAAIRQFERWGLDTRLDAYADPAAPMAERALRTRGVVLARRPGATACVVVFLGTASQYLVSLRLLYGLLPADRHLVFLKDPDRRGYLTGVDAFGSGFAALKTGVRRLIARLGAERVDVIGTSSGGFPALHFALTERARGLALSPETEVSGLAAVLGAAGIPASQLPEPLDLVALYPGREAPAPVVLAHGAEHAGDAAMCRRLAGRPGVSIRPVPECDQHDVLGVLLRRGALQPLLAELLGPVDECAHP
ncbi:hypothetical protein V5F53_20625 [Xanthobacter sp. V4C-4]|uniref:alpha/beta fold hydrolase n=1 Tax=Xanthobacter cornucopiae TaxID=3119924 RepID=UPI00372B129C